MAKKKLGRGGAREGSGRKVSPEGRAIVIAGSVPESLVVRLEALAKDEGWSRSQAITEAIRGLLQRKKR